jgi:hypothetical protein
MYSGATPAGYPLFRPLTRVTGTGFIARGCPIPARTPDPERGRAAYLADRSWTRGRLGKAGFGSTPVDRSIGAVRRHWGGREPGYPIGYKRIDRWEGSVFQRFDGQTWIRSFHGSSPRICSVQRVIVLDRVQRGRRAGAQIVSDVRPSQLMKLFAGFSECSVGNPEAPRKPVSGCGGATRCLRSLRDGLTGPYQGDARFVPEHDGRERCQEPISLGERSGHVFFSYLLTPEIARKGDTRVRKKTTAANSAGV